MELANPRQAAGGVRLRLLGRFELSIDGSLLRTRPSGERLLAYLAIREEPIARSEVASALWPDYPDDRAASNLRSALFRLPREPQGGLVSSRAGQLALTPGVATDLAEIADCLANPDRTGGDMSIGLLQQEVLPGWPEIWLVTTREWFRQMRLRALERICDQDQAAGRLDAALEAGLAAVACDPLRESAHRRLAIIHMTEGNLAEALRQYHSYRELMRSELGLAPSSQFRRLIAPLLGRPADQIA